MIDLQRLLGPSTTPAGTRPDGQSPRTPPAGQAQAPPRAEAQGLPAAQGLWLQAVGRLAGQLPPAVLEACLEAQAAWVPPAEAQAPPAETCGRELPPPAAAAGLLAATIRGRRQAERPPTCGADGSCQRCGRWLWLELRGGRIVCAPGVMTEAVQYIAGLEFASCPA